MGVFKRVTKDSRLFGIRGLGNAVRQTIHLPHLTFYQRRRYIQKSKARCPGIGRLRYLAEFVKRK